MATELRSLFATEAVTASIRDARADRLLTTLGNPPPAERTPSAVLRLAAIAATSQLIGASSLDTWLRTRTSGTSADLAVAALERWDAHLMSCFGAGAAPDLDDMLWFAFSAQLARRPHEARSSLRGTACRAWLDTLTASAHELPWPRRVKTILGAATLLLTRQDRRADVALAGELLRHLAEAQRAIERAWLAGLAEPRRPALRLLAFYHLAEAVLRTAEFLLAGSVEIGGKRVQDYDAELSRLLVRAEEYIEAAQDTDLRQWVYAIGVQLTLLREASLWVQARGISNRIDRLLVELAAESRAHPVFSLLPSQQDALRQNLLDRSRIAIVLQMPTSAGKTLLAEFSIAQTFDAYRNASRVVYLVPTRALATQVRRTLAEDLGPLEITVSAAGSAFEEDPYEIQLLQDTDGVVVATPEKLDLLLRNHPQWFDTLRLVIVDEAHHLGEGERGARLELLLANLRREHPESRLLLLTPFMDNADQIARWLSRERGSAITVQWRPSQLVLGMATAQGRQPRRSLRVEWDSPTGSSPKPLELSLDEPATSWASSERRVQTLARVFAPLGTLLAMFSASPQAAEEAAAKRAETLTPLAATDRTPQLGLAIALARHEYGEGCALVQCLERGVAFHHSSLSPILRYLIEDQVRSGVIRFIAATSTLAQGMNFPVATILMHSVHKPYGGGNFTNSEFWNIAGRAGRVGLADVGRVVFLEPSHRTHLQRYKGALSESLRSALLLVLGAIRPDQPLKQQYRDLPPLRPFIQYLAHAAAKSSPQAALANLDALIQASLANLQIESAEQARMLRQISRAYLTEISGSRLLGVADSTGLGTFSFDELYAKIANDDLLRGGPSEVMARREVGLFHLVEALRWLPELDLAIGHGQGQMDVAAVARVVQAWIDGHQVHEMAREFPGDDLAARVRNAGRYLYGVVSQTISWGAHAFARGWGVTRPQGAEAPPPQDSMLPAYIQYGVNTPGAALATLLGVPRPFSRAFDDAYRSRFGELTPQAAPQFRRFVESADAATWTDVVTRSGVAGADPDQARQAVLQMQGIATRR